MTYQAYRDAACNEPLPVVNFSTTSDKTKTQRMSAGVPLRLVVNQVTKVEDAYVSGGVVIPQGPLKQYICIGMARFTPEAGKTYRLSVSRAENREAYTLNVINTETGAPPENLLKTKSEICQ